MSSLSPNFQRKKGRFAMICQAVRQNCWSPGAVPPRSSSRAPAESPAVSGVSVGSRNFVPRPLAVEPPTGGKNMRAPRPQTPRQVRITCTTAKQVCRLIKIVWYRGAASAAIQLRKLVVHSTKSPAGAVQSAQWRELDLSSSRATAESPSSCAVSGGSRTFGARPLAVGTADGGERT